MAWMAMPTFTAGALTSAQLNVLVNNLNETAPAKATGAGNWFVTNGVNTVVQRGIAADTVGTAEATTTTSYNNLATLGPLVGVTTGSRAIIFVSCTLTTDTVGQVAYASHAVTTASSIPANDTYSLLADTNTAGRRIRATAVVQQGGITPGANVFSMQYRVSGGTGTFGARTILVMGM